MVTGLIPSLIAQHDTMAGVTLLLPVWYATIVCCMDFDNIACMCACIQHNSIFVQIMRVDVCRNWTYVTAAIDMSL